MARSIVTLITIMTLIPMARSQSCDIIDMKTTNFNSCDVRMYSGTKVDILDCHSAGKLGTFTALFWLKFPKSDGYYTTGHKEYIFSMYEEDDEIFSLYIDSAKGVMVDKYTYDGNDQIKTTETVIKFTYETILTLKNFETFLLLSYTSEETSHSVSIHAGQLRNKIANNKVLNEEIELFVFESFNTSVSEINTVDMYYGGKKDINEGYQNCADIKGAKAIFDYAPIDIHDLNPQMARETLYNHIFLNKERSYIALDINLRTQQALFINEQHKQCSISRDHLSSYTDSQRDLIKYGYYLGTNDYFECVLIPSYPADNLTISFKFKFDKQIDENFYLMSFVQKNNEAPLYGESMSLDAEMSFMSIYINHDSELILDILGEKQVIAADLEIEKSYTVALDILKLSNFQQRSAGLHNRGVVVSINGSKDLSEILFFESDLSMFFVTSDNSSRNSYFYIGNYNISERTPKNYLIESYADEVLPSIETVFVYINDIVIAENSPAVSYTYKNVIANCRLLIPGHGCVYCEEGFHITNTGECIAKEDLNGFYIQSVIDNVIIQCATGDFFNSVLEMCQECPIDCYTCDSLKVCTAKRLGCQKGCLSCSVEDNNTCFICASTYKLVDGVCRRCLKSNCYACEDDLFTCKICAKGFYLNTLNNECTNCDPICKECSDRSNKCTSCNNGFYLDKVKNTCINIDSTFYLVENSIRKCPHGCKECESYLINSCKECDYSKYVSIYPYASLKQDLEMFECKNKCPEDYFYIENYKGMVGRFCLPCPFIVDACSQCVSRNTEGTEIHCLQCKPGYFLRVDTKNSYAHSCSKCNEKCVTCVFQPDNCSSCKTGEELTFSNVSKKFYCESLQLGAIGGSISRLHSDTLRTNNSYAVYSRNISGSSVDKNNNRLLEGFNDNDIQDDESPYSNGTKGINSAVDSSLFADCPRDSVIFGNKCLSECPVGYFARKTLNSACTPCRILTPNCFDCNRKTGVCDLCMPGFKLNNEHTCDNCYSNENQCCREGFGVLLFSECGACNISHCKACPYRNFCLQCEEGFVVSAKGGCEPKINNCVAYNYDSTSCLKCIAPLHYNPSTKNCETCDSDTYPMWLNGRVECASCNEACLTCHKPNSNKYCIECNVGYKKDYDNVCIPCSNLDYCDTYDMNEVCKCTACKNGYNLVEDQCYNGCPIGYFFDTNTSQCEKCFNCSSCTTTSPSSCSQPLKCITGAYKTDYNVCCPYGTDYNSGTEDCENLIANCKTGKDGNCHLAVDHYYYDSDTSSVEECPPDFRRCINNDSSLNFNEECIYGSSCSYSNEEEKYECTCISNASLSKCSMAYLNIIEDEIRCASCFTPNKLNPEVEECINSCPSGYQEITTPIDHENASIPGVNRLCKKMIHDSCLVGIGRFANSTCDACADGHYEFNSGIILYSNGNDLNNRYEITTCSKCHPDCKSCNGPRYYDCIDCAEDLYKFGDICIEACPENFVISGKGCKPSTCISNRLIYKEDQHLCTDLCPRGLYADKATKSCKQCSTGCINCTSQSKCRECDINSNLFLNDNTDCQRCSYFADKHSKTIEYQGSLNYLKLFSEALCSEAIIKDFSFAEDFFYVIGGKFTTQSKISVNVHDRGRVVLPDLKFPQSIHHVALRFDLELGGIDKWIESEFIVLANDEVVWIFKPTRWDFEFNYFEFSTTYQRERIVIEVFDQDSLQYPELSLKFVQISSLEDPNSYFQIKNLRFMSLKCPKGCIDCSNGSSCNMCNNNSVFNIKKNECMQPFDTLIENRNSEYIKYLNLSIKPQCFYLIFKDSIVLDEDHIAYYNYSVNFNDKPIDSKITYIRSNMIQIDVGPSLLPDSGSSGIAGKEPIFSNYNSRRLEDDFDNITFEFGNPFVFREQNTGLQVSPISIQTSIFKEADTFNFFDTIQDKIKANMLYITSFLFILNLINVDIFFSHFIFLFNRNLLYLFSVNNYSNEDGYIISQGINPKVGFQISLFWLSSFTLYNPTLINHSFKGPLRLILEAFVSEETVQNIDYMLFFNKIDRNSPVSFDIIDYLPFRSDMVQYRILVNFIYNVDIILTILILLGLFNLSLRIVLLIFKKRLFRKEKAINRMQKLADFIEFKFYIFIINRTFFAVLLAFLLQASAYRSANKLNFVGWVISLVMLIPYAMFYIASLVYNILQSNYSDNKHEEKLKKWEFFEKQIEFVEKEDIDLEEDDNIDNQDFQRLSRRDIRFLLRGDPNARSVLKLRNSSHLNPKESIKLPEEHNTKKHQSIFFGLKKEIVTEKEKVKEVLSNSLNQEDDQIPEERKSQNVAKHLNHFMKGKSSLGNRKSNQVHPVFKNHLKTRAQNNKNSHDLTEEEHKEVMPQRFGYKLGKLLEKMEKRNYYLRLQFITRNIKYIKFRNFCLRTAKYYYFITTTYKIASLLLLYFIYNNDVLKVVYCVMQIIFCLWFLLATPFINNLYNFVFDLFELIFTTFCIYYAFLSPSKLNTYAVQNFVLAVIVVGIGFYCLGFLVRFLMGLILLAKKLDPKRRRVSNANLHS